MRRQVGAGSAALRHQQRLGETGGRRLAVGAHHVDRLELPLGVPQPPEQACMRSRPNRMPNSSSDEMYSRRPSLRQADRSARPRAPSAPAWPAPASTCAGGALLVNRALASMPALVTLGHGPGELTLERLALHRSVRSAASSTRRVSPSSACWRRARAQSHRSKPWAASAACPARSERRRRLRSRLPSRLGGVAARGRLGVAASISSPLLAGQLRPRSPRSQTA